MSSRDPRSYPYAPEPASLPLLRGEALSGWLLTRLVVGLGVWLVLGSLACALLALAGWWSPLVAGPVLLVLAAASLRVAALVPARPLPVWVTVVLVAVSLGFTLWAGATHAEQVLPRRDSGSYLQSSVELAANHARPIEVPAAGVGAPDSLRVPGVTLASPAFYATGTPQHPQVQPQFPVGPSAFYSLAWWLGGARAAFWAPAVLGGVGVLGIGLLAALVVGPRWSPLAALGTAICFPVLHVSRSTYSEPLALVVLAAALVALAQAAQAAALVSPVVARRAAVVAGALLGGGVLIRVDTLREAILLIPVAALAMVQRQAHGGPAVVAAGASAAVGLGVDWLTSSEYLKSIGGSILPLLALGIGLGAVAALVVAAARRGRRLPLLARAWLPRAAAAVVVVGAVLLATRPLWQTVRQSAADPGSRVVAGLQLRQGLRVDGGRTYAEQTLVWTSWWLGPAALVLAGIAVAVLAHRLASAWVEDRPLPRWTGPFLVALGSSVLTWYRPGITPDHPWADRRLLIPLVLAVLLVVGAAATVGRWSTRRLPLPVMALGSVAITLALLVPTALATWPHANERVERGELAAVRHVCDALQPGDVALMVDSRAANEWPEVLRGQCGVPALSTTAALRRDPEALARAVGRVRSAVEAGGSHLVLVSADSAAPLAALGATDLHQVLDTTVQEDARLLERCPDHLVGLPLTVWLGRPAP